MQALETEFRTQPQPILTENGDGFDDDQPPRCKGCAHCYGEGYDKGHAHGYDLGLRDGAASVRKAPFFTVDWSTLTGGIINTLGFATIVYIALWAGELRGMNSDGRFTIISEEKAVKSDAETVIRGTNGTTIVIKREAQ